MVFRILGGLQASINVEDETKVGKEDNKSNTKYIEINHDSPLKLKCSISSRLPHIGQRWHSCRWTEKSSSGAHRECSCEYSNDSTHSKPGKRCTCYDSETNATKGTFIELYSTGEHDCILDISPDNNIFREVWTTWTRTFVECETADCAPANCTASAEINVYVRNSNNIYINLVKYHFNNMSNLKKIILLFNVFSG